MRTLFAFNALLTTNNRIDVLQCHVESVLSFWKLTRTDGEALEPANRHLPCNAAPAVMQRDSRSQISPGFLLTSSSALAIMTIAKRSHEHRSTVAETFSVAEGHQTGSVTSTLVCHSWPK